MTSSQGSDFESLARQYWNAWGETMRQGGAAGTPAGTPGWQDAVDWWSKLARGDGADANASVDRFNAQARDWYGQMQQVAAKFAGQQANAADITAEWKRALGAIGENPFPEMFKAMQGPGAQGFDQWTESAKPFLDAWRREGQSILGMPAFGSGREQQERLQKLMQAQLDFQQREGAYNALMMKALQRAYGVFQDKLAEREEPGRQLTSARALFDLWIDAAEEAYAQVALSPEFREVYGAYVNAQMRLRNGMQREVEQVCAAMGMPTRTEVDAAHRKIAELERVLRRMRDAGSAANAAHPEPRTSASARPAVAKKPAAKRTVGKSKPAAKPAPTAKRKR
jgi:polyhydroxyalkanoate synthase subunit PhaE